MTTVMKLYLPDTGVPLVPKSHAVNVLLKFEVDIEAAGKQLAGLTQKAREAGG